MLRLGYTQVWGLTHAGEPFILSAQNAFRWTDLQIAAPSFILEFLILSNRTELRKYQRMSTNAHNLRKLWKYTQNAHSNAEWGSNSKKRKEAPAAMRRHPRRRRFPRKAGVRLAGSASFSPRIRARVWQSCGRGAAQEQVLEARREPRTGQDGEGNRFGAKPRGERTDPDPPPRDTGPSLRSPRDRRDPLRRRKPRGQKLPREINPEAERQGRTAPPTAVSRQPREPRRATSLPKAPRKTQAANPRHTKPSRAIRTRAAEALTPNPCTGPAVKGSSLPAGS